MKRVQARIVTHNDATAAAAAQQRPQSISKRSADSCGDSGRAPPSDTWRGNPRGREHRCSVAGFPDSGKTSTDKSSCRESNPLNRLLALDQ